MKKTSFLLFFCLLAGFIIGGAPLARAEDQSTPPAGYPHATFAGGCFWCLQSEFKDKPGVLFTRAGYAGGQTENPTYDAVSSGKTGHAEALDIYYDPARTNYQALVDHFLRNAHDPTTMNQQWVDRGTQYRSMIFYHDAEQKKIAEDTIDRIDAEKIYKGRIVTEVVPATTFWVAEDEHQDYYQKYEEKTGTPHIREVLKAELKKKKSAEALRSAPIPE